jgi:hypothetical protein
MLTRRQFLLGGMGAGLGGFLATITGKNISASGVSHENEYREGTVLILLGTTGGPRILEQRASPSSLIVINDQLYAVDCEGVPRQLALAGFGGQNF